METYHELERSRIGCVGVAGSSKLRPSQRVTHLGTNDPSDSRKCSCRGCRPALIARLSVHSGRTMKISACNERRESTCRNQTSTQHQQIYQVLSVRSCWVKGSDERGEHVQHGNRFGRAEESRHPLLDLLEHLVENSAGYQTDPSGFPLTRRLRERSLALTRGSSRSSS